MILYSALWSTNCQRVTMALGHKGLDFGEAVISYEDRSWVHEVSGQPLVPVLVLDDDEVVVDSMAIVARLEELHPDPPLYPADPAKRAEVEVFIDWFNRVWKVAPNAIEAGGDVVEHSGTMAGHLDLVEALLTGREYLFGPFTAADVCAFPFLKYAASRDPADDEAFHVILDEHQSVEGRPNLAAWIDRVASAQEGGL